MRYVQNVARKHNFCENFKMSTESTIFARISKCRAKPHFLRDFQNVVSFLRDFQNVDRKHNFCEIFKMSTKNPIFARFSHLRLLRGVRICGHRWVALARPPSSIFAVGLEKRLPFLDLSALLLEFHKTSFSTEDPGHENDNHQLVPQWISECFKLSKHSTLTLES